MGGSNKPLLGIYTRKKMKTALKKDICEHSEQSGNKENAHNRATSWIMNKSTIKRYKLLKNYDYSDHAEKKEDRLSESHIVWFHSAMTKTVPTLRVGAELSVEDWKRLLSGVENREICRLYRMRGCTSWKALQRLHFFLHPWALFNIITIKYASLIQINCKVIDLVKLHHVT